MNSLLNVGKERLTKAADIAELLTAEVGNLYHDRRHKEK